MLLDGKAVLLLSPTLMVEYEAVLTRPKNLALFGIGIADVLARINHMPQTRLRKLLPRGWKAIREQTKAA